MDRRKFLVGLGSTAAGGAALIGSGAFSQATVQREIELNIQPDLSGEAYLDLFPDSPYAEYSSRNLKLSFTDNGRGSGITTRGNMLFEDVFGVKNQGTNTVDVLLPSFTDVSVSTVQTAAAAASTEFLVDKGSNQTVSDFDGVRLCNGETNVNVDAVDISWPLGISPANKPSNPVPQYTDNCSGGSWSGQVVGSYNGLRYPGGAVRLDPGDQAKVDVRFTVSNKRPGGTDSRSAGILYRATESPASDDDWAV